MTNNDVANGKDLHASGSIQDELFVIDGLDVVAKDDLVSMEHAFYSLTKKPVTKLEPYEYKEYKIEFRPSISGFPTIYDKDLVIFAVSCVIAMTEENEEPPRYITFDPHDFLVFTGRSTGGRSYDALSDSVDRLKGSYFKTNIPINGHVKHSWRSIIGDVELLADEKTNKPKEITIQLSDMLIETIKNKGVLTLNRDYFRIKKPIERRIYQLARKHAGHQAHWRVNLKTLHKKSGSRGSLREFRRSIKKLVTIDDLPDYHTAFDVDSDQLTFTRKQSFITAYKSKPTEPSDVDLPVLKPAVITKVKNLCPRDICVYQLEADWRDYWAKNGRQPLDDHNAAFIGWSKKVLNQSDYANA